MVTYTCPSCVCSKFGKFSKEGKEDLVELKNQIVSEVKDCLQEVMKKAKPSFAEIVGGDGKDKKAMNKFAACVANTQKKICDDREERKNNINFRFTHL